jgi:hypothetical protein
MGELQIAQRSQVTATFFPVTFGAPKFESNGI